MQVKTVTKTDEAAETVTVELNYEEWLQEFEQQGTCTYKGELLFLNTQRERRLLQ